MSRKMTEKYNQYLKLALVIVTIRRTGRHILE
jgi:hypothetical protein